MELKVFLALGQKYGIWYQPGNRIQYHVKQTREMYP